MSENIGCIYNFLTEWLLDNDINIPLVREIISAQEGL